LWLFFDAFRSIFKVLRPLFNHFRFRNNPKSVRNELKSKRGNLKSMRNGLKSGRGNPKSERNVVKSGRNYPKNE
jgi:hypothetical protein